MLHVDADELYRVALGMYDLPLAYMVIANAQVTSGIDLPPSLTHPTPFLAQSACMKSCLRIL
jgi:hypothetical protein